MRLTIAILFVLACAGYVWHVESRLRHLSSVEALEMLTAWMSGGVTKQVRSEQMPGESLADFQDRHFAAVRAKQVNFPPDVP